jgi:hypothetical protein
MAVTLIFPIVSRLGQRTRGRSSIALAHGRRDVIAGIAAFVCIPSGAATALPRGGVDARVANAFNEAFAAGGDPAVCRQAYQEPLP